MSGSANSEAIDKIKEMEMSEGMRLVTITAADEGEGSMELIYVLDREGELLTVRSHCRWEDELESLSSLYKGAENMEREIIDLLGAKFVGIKGGLFIEPGSGIVNPLRKEKKEVQ